MGPYKSELEEFLQGLQRQHPDLEQKQRAARAMWWDRKTDPEDEVRYHEARVQRGSYVFYPIPEDAKTKD
jgi:hypothetical protein